MFTTGVDPLDTRLGELEAGGLYLLAGPPDSVKLAALLQFLSVGLDEGARCALVTGSDPRSVLAQAGRWGMDLEDAWKDRRLVVLGFEGDFARRLAHAGQPEAVFDELAGQLDDDLSRIAIDPGAPLWETRTDGAMGTRFLDWVTGRDVTVWATVSGSLSERLSPSTEWVMQGARGVLEFERLPDGSRQIWVRKLDAPLGVDGPISVELIPGEGLVAPRGEPGRRRTDIGGKAARRLLLLRLTPRLPDDLEAWARSRYVVRVVDDPLLAVQTLGDETELGTCLVYLDRSTMDRGIQVCRTLRPLTPASLVLVSDEALRADDRARALEAGADEVMSDGLHLRELENRLRRSRREEGRYLRVPAPETSAATKVATQDVLEPGEFRARVAALVAEEPPAVFTLLRLALEDGADRLLEVVRGEIRSDVGDIASSLDGREVDVLLREARPGQAATFLKRLRRTLPAPDAEALDVETWGSPVEAPRIKLWASA